MYLIIDNRDSFVHNIRAYFREFGQEVVLRDSHALHLQEIEAMRPHGIILSPGPGRPEDAGISIDVVRAFASSVPILGVCLGHQVIAHAFGGKVTHGTRPMHGKISPVHHSEMGLFANLVNPLPVVRYHSLVVRASTLPDDLVVDAKTSSGTVMALSHRQYPVYGVQFHPEAYAAPDGHELFTNFCRICDRWWGTHG
jgi:para-aminobenzoate synthetase component II